MNLYELYNHFFTLNFFHLYLNDLKDSLKARGIAVEGAYVNEIDDEYNIIGEVRIYLETNNLHEKWRPNSFYLYSNGRYVADSMARDFLNHDIAAWTAYVRDRAYAAQRIRNFWGKSKEELVATVWRPDRVAKWVEAGVSVEEL